MSTKIEWTDVTVNPFPGCRKISPGCLNCFAEKMARRLKAMGQSTYADVVDERGWTGKVGCDPKAMRVPGKGKMVFVNSMGDLFYEGTLSKSLMGAEDEAADRVFAMVAKQPQHTFQVLTKRPEAMKRYFAGKHQDLLSHGTWFFRDGRIHPKDGARLGMFGFPDHWPLPNLWLGVTAENQDYEWRIRTLLHISAAVRFVSFEPLLGPVEMSFGDILGPDEDSAVGWGRCDIGGVPHQHFLGDHCDRGIGWIITGVETGPSRRPCDNDWIRRIVDQCHAAEVPVFVKTVTDARGKIVKDLEQIGDILGYAPESLRQWPRRPRP
jgi:protein gp37